MQEAKQTIEKYVVLLLKQRQQKKTKEIRKEKPKTKENTNSIFYRQSVVRSRMIELKKKEGEAPFSVNQADSKIERQGDNCASYEFL